MHERPGARRSRAAARGHGCDLGQAALVQVQVWGHTLLAPCNPFAPRVLCRQAACTLAAGKGTETW